MLVVNLNYDVIVVGAGPGGATAAWTCAQEGLRVAFLEEHEQPGTKVCAGGLDYRIIRIFNIEDDAIQCHIKKYLFYAPSGKCITQKIESATVNRSEFDRYLADRAVDAGATLFVSTFCQGVLKNDNTVVGVVAKTPKGLKRFMGKVVVAADGFNSITARSAGLLQGYGSSDVGLTVQRDVYVDSKIEDDAKHLFYGKDVSPCGFGWIYPKKNCYTVGLGSLMSYLEKGRLTRNLEYLISEHPIASKILSKIVKKSNIQAACVPLKLGSQICGDGIVVVGDAAGQVSPLGGNGIYYAMNAGALAGHVTTDAIAQEDVSKNGLRKYQENFLSQHGKELLRQKRILEKVEGYFDLYMEARLFLDSHETLKRFYDSGRALASPFLRL